MPELGRTFDVVVMNSVIEHMNTMVDALELSKQVLAMLNPGGRFVLYAPDYANWRHHFFIGDFSHSYITSWRRLEELLISAGYRPRRRLLPDGDVPRTPVLHSLRPGGVDAFRLARRPVPSQPDRTQALQDPDRSPAAGARGRREEQGRSGRAGMTDRTRRILGLLLRVLVATILLAWVFTQVDFGQFARTVKAAQVALPHRSCGLSNVVFSLLQSYALQIILRKQECQVGLDRLFAVSCVTAMYSLILFGIVSTGVKWYMLKRTTGKGTNVLSSMLYNQADAVDRDDRHRSGRADSG